MKFLITENKLEELIFNRIENYYDWNKIYTEKTNDGDGLFFVNPDSGITDVFFFDNRGVLDVYDDDFIDYMNAMFNNRWTNPFVKFMENKYRIKIKSSRYFN